jgi:hypothetical protein
MQPGIWADAEAFVVVQRNAHPSCYLGEVICKLEASTSREGDRHHAKLQLNNLAQDGSDIRFLQLHSHVAKLGTSCELHQDILRLRSVV